MADAPVDGRRVKGERTRQQIVRRAAALASAEGLASVSLQRLASDLGLSKSGVFAHFRSKEELQIATIAEAARIFTHEVLRPGLRPPAGIARIWALADAFLSYVERDVFPGGCFFEAVQAEFDSRPGRVRDEIIDDRDYFTRSLVRAVSAARQVGELRPEIDPEQLGWEISSLLTAANNAHVAHPGGEGPGRARRAVRDRLQSAATPKAWKRFAEKK